MRNLRLSLTLSFALDWRVGVTISMPDGIPNIDFSDSGTLDLGTLKLGIGFGDLTLPGLSNLAFDVPSLPVNDVSAVIGPIKNLNLGAALAEHIKAQNLVTPTRGFQVRGLGVGSVSAQGISIPDAALGSANIGRISGGTLPISGLSIPNIALPPVMIPRMSSQDVGATSNAVVSKLPTADVGLFAATLKVTTTAQFHLDELRLDNIAATASIGEIALKNVELPYEILDLTLSQLGIENLEVPQVEVN
jgi:hypothetical protein